MITLSKTVLKVIAFTDPDEEVLSDAVEVLKAGYLVVAPTETRYALLASANESSSVDKLYSIKGRPKHMPSAIFVKDTNEMTQYGTLNETARKLADTYLPGKLTLVVPSTVDLPAPIVSNKKIGFRVSSAPFIQKLRELVDFPITATSANISGQEDAEDANQIARQFGSKIQLYVEAGKLTGPVSTVVDCSSDSWEILREGAITKEEIEKTLV